MNSAHGLKRGIVVACTAFAWAARAGEAPTDNPVAARYGADTPAWVAGIPWTRVVALEAPAQGPADAALARAQETAVGLGGAVVYIPAGTYTFTNHVLLRGGVVLRGETPPTADALAEGYKPAATFVFPRYAPTFEGNGTPNDTAFKGVRLADPAVRRAGIVFIAIENGHIEWGGGRGFGARFESGAAGREWLVYGCALRHCAIPDPAVPARVIPKTDTPFQEGWQRWTHRHHAAIEMHGGGDILIANNRLPESGEANFVMKDYRLCNNTPESEGLRNPAKLKVQTADVTFNYDNRPGISVNYMGLSPGLAVWDPYVKAAEAKTNAPPASALKPPPAGLARGIVIRDNYVFCFGCTGIRATGDGTKFIGNVIRFKKGAALPTARGLQLDHFTNNNRAIEVRGWRWVMDGNDYEVYSNVNADGRRYGDGEGLMHEGYDNLGVVDSAMLNNKGNAYLCIWRVPVEGLLIRSNTVDSVKVLCATNRKLNLPCDRLQIVGNRTGVGPVGTAASNFGGGGILVLGGPPVNSEVRGNRHEGENGKLEIPAGMAVSDNAGYQQPATQ